jgi:hypothetical protein
MLSSSQLYSILCLYDVAAGQHTAVAASGDSVGTDVAMLVVDSYVSLVVTVRGTSDAESIRPHSLRWLLLCFCYY